MDSRSPTDGDMRIPATSSAPWTREGLSHLVVRRPATADADRLAWAIRAARSWLGLEIEPAPPGMHRHQTAMRLRVSDRPAIVTFRKAAYVDLGPLRSVNDGWEAEVGWQAATLAPLFPVVLGEPSSLAAPS